MRWIWPRDAQIDFAVELAIRHIAAGKREHRFKFSRKRDAREFLRRLSERLNKLVG